MAKVYDVPPDKLIDRLSEVLKTEDIPAPSWIPFVKTGAHADKPPQNRDWWHTRCASILRKIYLRGPVGINKLRKNYGGGKPSGYGAAHHKDAGGAIIRNAIQGLEKLGYVEQLEKKGRIISKQGMQKLDKLATEILNEEIAARPELKVYS
ncbi:MAG: 30S ribosomal protein S19e [Thaumarchaeota archaeon]|nr:30S ribosomal protein S19e [Nitrososphaerota archaeon]